MMKLLDDFGKLSIRDERPQTFMEIAGLPRREDACSKILAFFLDPEEAHGLGTLVLDALADARNKNETFGNGRIGGNVSVETEVVIDENKTAKNPRIVNPFCVYASYQEKIARARLEPKIRLTVTPSSAGSNEGFDNITHARFIREIRSRLGSHVSEADTRYLTLFLDFLNTLEILKEGTRMDRRLVVFLAKRRGEVVELLTKVEDFNKELEKKGKELRTLIDAAGHENVEQGFWCDRKELYCDLIHDIQISETLTIVLDASIFPEGWQIWMWPHGGDQQMLTDRSEMRALLDSLKISADEYYDEGFLHRLSYDHEYDQTLTYDEDINSVADLLQGLIDTLAIEGAKNR